ncbi:MAG: MCP four helix bundle domain-containing protein, partial [Bacteriovorax sp.]
MFNKMNLKSRIIAGFLVVSSFAIIVGLIGYYFLGQVISKYDHVAKVNFNNNSAMSDMRDNVRVIRTRVSILGFKKVTEAEVKEAQERIDKAIAEYEQADKKYNDIPFVAGEEAIYTPVNAGWKASKKLVSELLEIYKKEGASDRFFEKFHNEYLKVNDEYLKSMDILMNFQKAEAEKWSKEATEIGALATKISVAVLIAALVISLTLGTFLAKTLTDQLAKVIRDLNEGAPKLGYAATSMSSVS